MTSAQAKRLILVAVVAGGGLAVVRAYSKGESPSARIGLGATMAGVMLSVLAEVKPKIAGGLAMVMLSTAVFYVGGDAWKGISAAVAMNRAASVGSSTGGASMTPRESADSYAAREGNSNRTSGSTSSTKPPSGGSGGGGGGGGSW